MPSDVQIRGADGGAPQSYTVPNATEIVPKAVNATFDGSATAGSYVPTLEMVSDGGVVIARIPCATTVAAGGSAEVSWFPSAKPCPEGSPCPAWPGGDVCGGIANFGSFATGTGGGATTDLFVNRTVSCDSLVIVLGVSLAAAGFDGAIISGCTDTHKDLYNVGVSSIEGQTVGPSNALEASLAIAYVGANTLVAGNTITVTWDPFVTVIDSACMAFALTNVGLVFSDSANGIAYPGTLGESDSSLTWGAAPGIGEPTANFGGFVGAVFSFIGVTGNVGFNNVQGTLLDVLGSASCAAGAALIPSLNDGDSFEPGYTGGPWTVGVANYTELVA